MHILIVQGASNFDGAFEIAISQLKFDAADVLVDYGIENMRAIFEQAHKWDNIPVLNYLTAVAARTGCDVSDILKDPPLTQDAHTV
jgi:hypothetical protein